MADSVTPPGLGDPLGSVASSPAARRAMGELGAREGFNFQRASLPYLRVLFGDVVETPAMGVLDRNGIDHLTVPTTDGAPPVVIQCKGFQVGYHEVGRDQAQQCLDSIQKFRTQGGPATGYLLLHNRDDRSQEFREPLNRALAELVTEGRVQWAIRWTVRDLVEHVMQALLERVEVGLGRASEQAAAVAWGVDDGARLDQVPIVEYEMVAYASGRAPKLGTRVSAVDDPVERISDASADLHLLLGGFGFGKSTTAARAATSLARHDVLLLAARIDSLAGTKELLAHGLGDIDVLSDVPGDDAAAVRPLLPTAVSLAFRQGRNFTLIIDGVDESPLANRPGGFATMMNSLREVRVPIILTMRSEFWRAKRDELSTALPAGAPEKPPAGRTVHVVELTDWTDEHVLALIAATPAGSEQEQMRLAQLADLVRNGSINTSYGDIPRRPLFLRMLIDDVLISGIRRRTRLDLIEDWIKQKLVRDWTAPIAAGGAPRPPITDALGDSLDERLRQAERFMRTASVAMTHYKAGDVSIYPSARREDVERAYGQPVGLAALVTQSLLVPEQSPDDPGPEHLRFAHRAFQELYLAKAIHQGEAPDLRPPTQEVDSWLREIRARGPR